MRFLVGLLLGALASAPAAAAPFRAQGWAANGIPIASTPDFEISPMIVSDGDGGAVIAWVRFHPDSGGIYAVGLDPDGNVRPGWVPGGRVVHGGTDPHLVADGAGGAFIASRSFGAIAIQRFGPSSSPAGSTTRSPRYGGSLGARSGTADPAGGLRAQHNGLILPVMTLDGVGGAFVAFQDEQRFGNNKAFVRHYEFGGSFVQAQLEGRPGCSPLVCGGDATPTLCEDGAGGAFVAWGASCGPRVLRLTASLAVVPGWPDSGLLVESCRTSRPHIGIGPDGAGGAYVVWQGSSAGTSDVRIHRVTGSGQLAAGWPADGLVLSPNPTLPGVSRPGYGEFSAIVPDGQGGALVSWSDQRSDAGDVYVSRVMPDGTIASGWPRYGVGAGVAPGMQQWPMVAADASGGAVVAWQDERNAPDLAIYTNHVTSGGAIVPPGTADGVQVSSGPGPRRVPRLASDGAGGAIIAWVDYRAGNGDIYAARVRADGIVGTLADLVRAEADVGGVRLEWRVSPDVLGPVQLERRSLESDFGLLANLTPDGSHRVAYEDREIEPGGRYAYRLGLSGAEGLVHTDVVWVTVPPPPALVLEGIHPNPTTDDFDIGLSLPGPGGAWLEIVDLAGRVRMRQEVGTLGRGRHQVTIGSGHALAPGIYFVRLMRAGEARTARLCLIR